MITALIEDMSATDVEEVIAELAGICPVPEEVTDAIDLTDWLAEGNYDEAAFTLYSIMFNRGHIEESETDLDTDINEED